MLVSRRGEGMCRSVARCREEKGFSRAKRPVCRKERKKGERRGVPCKKKKRGGIPSRLNTGGRGGES